MNALKEETEQKIIKAAHEVFIEKGLEGARMQEIADRAGINKALLHYYFRSKDKLFDAVFQNIIRKVIPEFIKTVQSDMEVPNLLRSFVTFYNDFFQKNPYLPQFFFHEIWQHPDRLADFIKSQNLRPNEMVMNLNKKLPVVDETTFLGQHMIANVMGMCLFPHIARPLFQRIFFNNDDEMYNRFLDERTDFLMKILRGITEHNGEKTDQDPKDDF